MKNSLFLFHLLIVSLVVSAQTELKSIDSTLKSLNANVGAIKDEVVKKEEAPFTGQSIFEDRTGNSAIFLPFGGTFRLNAADGSLKLSFVNRVSTKKFFYGFDISGKTNDGILSFISSGNISPGAKANVIIGLQELFHSSDKLDGWVTMKLGYVGSSFKLFRPDSQFSSQLKKTSFNSLTSSLSFNMKIGGTKLFAASIGYRKANNYDNLDEIELRDQKLVRDSASNVTRTYEDKIKVRVGDYETFNQVPINLDFFWVPKYSARIGVYHYWRGNIREGNFKNGFGSGLYLLKKNNPLSSIAGLVFEVTDVSKLKDGFGKNFSINFIVGYNFGFKK